MRHETMLALKQLMEGVEWFNEVNEDNAKYINIEHGNYKHAGKWYNEFNLSVYNEDNVCTNFISFIVNEQGLIDIIVD